MRLRRFQNPPSMMFSYGFPSAVPDAGCVRRLVPHHNCIMVCLYTLVNAYNHKQFSSMWDFLKGFILVGPILYERSKCSIINPYYPKTFSRVKEKHSEQLAEGFSCASPPNCTSQPTTPNFPQRLWHCAVHIKHILSVLAQPSQGYVC